MAMDEPVLRPLPRRPFSLTSTPDNGADSSPSSPAFQRPPLSPSMQPQGGELATSPPSRNRSILNLTSSTLLGIYSRTGYAPDRDEPTTPWGTGAQTPSEARSRHSSQPDSHGLGIDALSLTAVSPTPRSRRRSVLEESTGQPHRRALSQSANKQKRKAWRRTLGKGVVLACVGACYGLLISHLHDKQGLAPVKMEGMPHFSQRYLIAWAGVAIVLGELMPFIDGVLGGDDSAVDDDRRTDVDVKDVNKRSRRRGGWAPVWNDAVRSIGAFVGIAFAIRKLPWESTMQLSLTLALSNPAIWYLLDHTMSGFVFSTSVALFGTAVCLAINPNLIPAPLGTATQTARASGSGNLTGIPNAAGKSHELGADLFSPESIGVATWVASVLFVSCVCFGNIGRRL